MCLDQHLACDLCGLLIIIAFHPKWLRLLSREFSLSCVAQSIALGYASTIDGWPSPVAEHVAHIRQPALHVLHRSPTKDVSRLDQEGIPPR